MKDLGRSESAVEEGASGRTDHLCRPALQDAINLRLHFEASLLRCPAHEALCLLNGMNPSCRNAATLDLSPTKSAASRQEKPTAQ